MYTLERKAQLTFANTQEDGVAIMMRKKLLVRRAGKVLKTGQQRLLRLDCAMVIHAQPNLTPFLMLKEKLVTLEGVVDMDSVLGQQLLK